MSEEEKKPIVFELNAEKLKAMTPEEILQQATKLHKQILDAIQEEGSSSQQTQE